MNHIIQQTNDFFRKKPERAETTAEQKEFLRECYDIRKFLNETLTRASLEEKEKLSTWTLHFQTLLRAQGIDASVESICAPTADEILDRR